MRGHFNNVFDKFTLIAESREVAFAQRPDEFNTFVGHNGSLCNVHTELVDKSVCKLAARHFEATGSNGLWERAELFSSWGHESVVTDTGADLLRNSLNLLSGPPNPVVPSLNSDLAFSKLNLMTRSFTSQPTLLEVQADMTRLVDESLLGCIVPWDAIHSDPMYYTVVISVAALLSRLTLSKLEFLMEYTRWDEPGVLFVMLKYIANKVRSYFLRFPVSLYPPGCFYQFMLGLYTPGAFYKFMYSVVASARNMIHDSFESFPILQNVLQGLWEGGGRNIIGISDATREALVAADRRSSAAARVALAASIAANGEALVAVDRRSSAAARVALAAIRDVAARPRDGQ